LINSGAAVAILAFISTLASRSGITLANLKAVTNSLYWFTGGIVSAGFTGGFAYLCNSRYANYFFTIDKIWEHPYLKQNAKSQRALRWARFFNWAGLILAYVGLFLFIRGVYVAAHAIEKLVEARGAP
jgi:hypothetical protein